MRAVWIVALVLGCGNGSRTGGAGPVGPGPVGSIASPPAPPAATVAVVESDWFPRATLVEQAGAVWAVAVHGSHVYWLAGEGNLYRVGLDGGEREALGSHPSARNLAVSDGVPYLLTDNAVLAVSTADGTSRTVVEVSGGQFMVAFGARLFVSGDAEITAVDAASGTAATLVDDPGYVVGLATDGESVYWAVGGDAGYTPGGDTHCIARDVHGNVTACPERPPVEGAIRRVSAGGGAAEVLVAEAGFPTGIATAGDWVYWSTEDSGAVLRVAKTGGEVRRMFGGAGTSVVADEFGVVADAGVMIELSGSGGPPRVRSMVASTMYALTDRAIIMADEWDERIYALPRGAASVEILATARSRLVDAVLSGDYLYYLDVHWKADDRVLRVPRAGGPIEVVHRQKGSPMFLAVDGDTVATADPYFNKITVGDTSFSVEGMPLGVAITGDRIIWVEDNVLMSKPLAGGEPSALYEPDHGMGWGMGGPPAATIVTAGDAVWAAGGGIYSLVRHAGGQSASFEDVTEPIAPAGDGVVAVQAERGVVVLPEDRVVLEIQHDQWPSHIAADSRYVYMPMRFDEGSSLARVPIGGGALEAMRIDVPITRLLADEDAVYIVSEELGVVMRVATGSRP